MFDEALQDLTTALQINPSYTYAYNNRGNVYWTKNQIPEAIEDYTKALELDNKYGNAYMSRGICYHQQKEFRKAVVEFSKAIKYTGKARAFCSRGRSFELLGKKLEALKDYEKALSLQPDYALAKKNLRILRETEPDLESAA
eukprot:TRINITY_DN1939_c0_g1_i2.p1 TRINITY_DN1939_c0_g1~~TRINITY_DN1939_c0_g1_i2.p1  ORF type:complete len:142 (-),score=29.49 TRINITY_DN1939_c0_g1_i2:59-484(-)